MLLTPRADQGRLDEDLFNQLLQHEMKHTILIADPEVLVIYT